MTTKRILEDHFLPGEPHFDEFLKQWPREKRAKIAAGATKEDVFAALGKDILHPEDFLALLSPAAEPYLEEMAQRSREITLRFWAGGKHFFPALCFRHLHQSLPVLRL